MTTTTPGGLQITSGRAPFTRFAAVLARDQAWTVVTVVLIAAVMGRLAIVGADSRWLAALGQIVATRHTIPIGVPFASASTAHWPNTLVLAELIFYWLEHTLGDAGLLLAQTVAVGLALAVLARDARAGGARTAGTCQVLGLVAVGSLSSFTLARVQLFSLVLFPLLLALLRAEHRQPSRRIWLVLPLLALWSNLHGTALAGLAILYVYLTLSLGRKNRLLAGILLIAAPLAMFATPAGLKTLDYYYNLTTNVAAQRGSGMWAPLGTGPLDLLLIGAALVLLLRGWRVARPPVWELVSVVLMAALTVKASRNGVWLLFLLAAPAAHASGARRDWLGMVPIAALAAVALLVSDVSAWANVQRATPAPIAQAVRLAHGSPILADSVPAEQIALAGGRVWAGNPLDAFSRSVQATYLDFIGGQPGGRAALDLKQIKVVVVSAGDAASVLVAADPNFRRVSLSRNTAIYVRRP